MRRRSSISVSIVVSLLVSFRFHVLSIRCSAQLVDGIDQSLVRVAMVCKERAILLLLLVALKVIKKILGDGRHR
jgi:hypothetical protein